MRFLMRAMMAGFVVCGGATAAGAQGYCPFSAFCAAQQHHCYANCGAASSVIQWERRIGFVEQCDSHCDAHFDRCMRRVARYCAAP